MVELSILQGYCTIQLWRKIGGNNRYFWTIEWEVCGNTLVYEVDFLRFNQFRWRMRKDLNTGDYYAYRAESQSGKQIAIYLAREILGLPRGAGCGGDQADHENHDTLNNGRDNLRVVTSSQSRANRREWGSRRLPKGVQKNNDGYQSYIKCNGSRVQFPTLIKKNHAWFMRKEAEKYVQGEYAYSEDIPADQMPTEEEQEWLKRLVIEKLRQKGFSV
jgi:hypothetical protein